MALNFSYFGLSFWGTSAPSYNFDMQANDLSLRSFVSSYAGLQAPGAPRAAPSRQEAIKQLKARLETNLANLESFADQSNIQAHVDEETLEEVFNHCLQHLKKFNSRSRKDPAIRFTSSEQNFEILLDEDKNYQLILIPKKAVVVATGGFKTVSQGYRIDTPTARMKAVGIMRMENPSVFQQELDGEAMSASLNHPNILKQCVGNRYRRGDLHGVTIVSKLAHGTLCNLVKDKAIDIETRRSLFMDVVSAVAYMNSQDQIHQDIKLDNVLVFKDSDGKYRAVLTDFGNSVHTECKQYKANSTYGYDSPEVLSGNCGTPYWFKGEAREKFKSLGMQIFEAVMILHPDIAHPIGDHTFPHIHNDSWALGVLGFQLFFGKYPTCTDIESLPEDHIITSLLKIDRDARSSAQDIMTALENHCKENHIAVQRPIVAGPASEIRPLRELDDRARTHGRKRKVEDDGSDVETFGDETEAQAQAFAAESVPVPKAKRPRR